MSGHSALTDYGITNIVDFMEEYRYNICHIVDVEKAFPWLRHRRVIDQYDEENILGRHNTSFLRTGHLVDILMKRGNNGFNALLEHIEYDYPEHFEKFTGKRARPCPESYRPQYRPRSGVILAQLSNLTQHLVKTYVDQRENQKCMAVTLRTLEGQITEFQNELERKEQQIIELSQKNLEIKEECKDYQNLLQQEREEKKIFIEECNQLRKLKDEYEAKCNNSASACSALEQRSLQRCGSQQMSLRDQNRNKLNQELVELRQEVEKYRSGAKCVTKEDITNVTIQQQKIQIEKLIDEKEKVTEEKENLCDEMERQREVVALYETSNNELQRNYNGMKAERDEYLRRIQDMQKMCESLQSTNMSLKGKVQERDSNMRHLINEATTYGYRPRLYQIKSPECRVPPRTPVFSELTVADEADSHYLYDQIQNVDPIPSVNTDSEEEGPPRIPPRSAPMSRSGAILSKRRHPLVLFSPVEIREPLEKTLLETDAFNTCPFEELRDQQTLVTWLEGGICIHYRKTDGHYLCVVTQTLREQMQRDDGGRVLLADVTPEAIQRMLNQRISPIVMVVKHRDLEQRDLKSFEEEELQRVHKDFHCQYEKILIDRNEEVSNIAKTIIIKCAASETSSRSGVYSNSSASLGRPSTSSV